MTESPYLRVLGWHREKVLRAKLVAFSDEDRAIVLRCESKVLRKRLLTKGEKKRLERILRAGEPQRSPPSFVLPDGTKIIGSCVERPDPDACHDGDDFDVHEAITSGHAPRRSEGGT